MKKISLIAALALCAMAANAQERIMRIHHPDGSSQTIKITDVDKITFENAGDQPCPVGPTDKMVDLGLSVMWAAWNVGATEPSDYGNFYAYGEIEPKEEYTFENYTYRDPDYEEGQFYEQWEAYYKLGSTFTGTNYDVAHVKWGEQWRIPTREEWKELINNTTWTWTAIGDVVGCRATSKLNGNSIFFPAAGNMVDADHTHDQLGCFYWTSSEYDGEPSEECRNYRANMDATYRGADGYDYPEVGFSVRAVYGPVPDRTAHLYAPSQPVDLGLSVKWAPNNIGSSGLTSGAYFCWGETEIKKYSHRFNYVHYDPISDTMANLGKSICSTEYDCATQCWNSDWRLPTAAEMQELIEKCTWTRSGYDVIVTGPNGNSITLPAMGYMTYRGKPVVGLSPIDTGIYLTGDLGDELNPNGTPNGGENCTVLQFKIAQNDIKLRTNFYRGAAVSVRPVYAK